MTRHVISYEDGHVYEFSPDMEPEYTAKDGESITVKTIDIVVGRTFYSERYVACNGSPQRDLRRRTPRGA